MTESNENGSGGGGENYSRMICELCALIGMIVSPAAAAPLSPARTRAPVPGMSPAAMASLLLGASVALMLCGSVTFAIGFLLMPWVAGLLLLLGFAGAVSTLSSGFGKVVHCCKDEPQRRMCSPITSNSGVY